MSVQTFFRLVALLAATTLARAQGVSLSVNTASREEVRQFYRTIYSASEGVAMGWTGNYGTGNAGDTSAAFKTATLLRINFFRALAGVPGSITLDSTFNTKDQQAALMLSVNVYSKDSNGNVDLNLSHNPPTSWTYYTAGGAEAASKSNIAYGNAGPDAVTAYMADEGPNLGNGRAVNDAVGHRRWLLVPQTQRMGTGDVPGDGTDARAAANAIWISDGTLFTTRPSTRTNYVAYPPAGYVPHTLVWPRWSFSLPDADFSAASVTMTRNGSPIAVALETYEGNIGENTLVWVYDGMDRTQRTIHPRPTADTTYHVTISGVKVGGVAQSPFAYDVIVFDPDKPGADTAAVAVSGNTLPTVNIDNTYTVAKPAFSATPTFEWRTATLTSFNTTYGANSGLEGLTTSTNSDYTVLQSIAAVSGQSYRLAHSSSGTRTPQYLRLPDTFFVGSSKATFNFASQLGYAFAAQTARVQISTDDGRSWQDIYTQTGTSDLTNPPQSTEEAFTNRSVSLGSYLNRTVSLRFAFTNSGSAIYPLSQPFAIGWFIDNISLSGVRKATFSSNTAVAAGSTFSFTPIATGDVALQARPMLFGAYPAEWGPVTQLTTTSGPSSSNAYLANLSVRSTAGTGGQTLIAGFYVSAAGSSTKKLVIRGVGPTLGFFGVSTALADPKLGIHKGLSPTPILENDTWSNDPVEFDKVGAFGLLQNSKDAALVTSLANGDYTAQVTGANNTTGIAIIELYDAAGGDGTRLTNISARSQVGLGEEILSAGFNVSGTGKKKLLIRGIGERLGQPPFNLPGVVANPKLELFLSVNSVLTPLAENDDWNPGIKSTFDQVGAFGLVDGSNDSAMVVELGPGTYITKVSGVGDTTGVAIIEVYELP